jgi:hypothetical protein
VFRFAMLYPRLIRWAIAAVIAFFFDPRRGAERRQKAVDTGRNLWDRRRGRGTTVDPSSAVDTTSREA